MSVDCFWDGPPYHYGPRNKNHRIYWDRTVIENPLEWVFEQFENKKLGAMIERAGYPGVATDLDQEKLASLLPTIKTQAFTMWEEGEALTGHPGLPLEVTPNLVTRSASLSAPETARPLDGRAVVCMEGVADLVWPNYLNSPSRNGSMPRSSPMSREAGGTPQIL